MISPNRRTFIKTAGVGAAAVGAVAIAGTSTTVTGAAAPVATAATPTASTAGTSTGAIAAYISDASTGKIAVMVEGHEVTITDHQLVAKLTHALKSSPKV